MLRLRPGDRDGAARPRRAPEPRDRARGDGPDLIQEKRYAEARAKYEEALAAMAPEEARQPLYFEFLIEMNYNLACI